MWNPPARAGGIIQRRLVMKTTVGIFTSRADAERAIEHLRSMGIAPESISLLTPGVAEQKLEAVATTETEQPGMGKAIGGVVGAALGSSTGMMLGAAAASLLVPGVGPVMASGINGAALFGIGGAAGGAAAGEALEEGMEEGLPRDELFVYEDALRRGRAVVIAMAKDDDQYEAIGEAMKQEGAESVDSARENWWVGLRDAEQQDYVSQGGDFRSDEPDYRRGFEAALHPNRRARSYDEVQGQLRECYGGVCEQKPFRRGYERGQAYYREIREKYKS
jgi:hypothetical protein